MLKLYRIIPAGNSAPLSWLGQFADENHALDEYNAEVRRERSEGIHQRPQLGLAPLWWRGIGSFGTGFFELSRAYEVEGGVPPDGIVEPVNVAANGLVGFLAGVEDGAPDELGF